MKTVINWQRIFDSNGIEYVDRGKNVKRGEISIQCPFCGSADPSHHMGVNLINGWWSCWRNESHRGKSPIRLLIRLLGISFQKAKELAGYDDDYVDPEGLTEAIRRLKDSGTLNNEEVSDNTSLSIEMFKKIDLYGSTARFYHYLLDRKFEPEDVRLLNNEYLLSAATSGSYKDRIIIPYILEGNIVSWTARAIADATIRYKDLPLSDSVLPPKHVLYNIDYAFQKGNYLVLVEGAFDALKIDVTGRNYGVRAVAISTKTITEQQIFLLEEVSFNFKKVIVMLDADKSTIGIIQSMKMKERLSQIRNIGFCQVPFGLKDAGEMNKKQAKEFCRSLNK